MTDEELIARLRSNIFGTGTAMLASDRIEALTAMHDTMSELWAKEAAEKNVLAGQCEDLEAKLAKAVEAIGILEDALQEAGDDYPGSNMQKWCQQQVKAARKVMKGESHE